MQEMSRSLISVPYDDTDNSTNADIYYIGGAIDQDENATKWVCASG